MNRISTRAMPDIGPAARLTSGFISCRRHFAERAGSSATAWSTRHFQVNWRAACMRWRFTPARRGKVRRQLLRRDVRRLDDLTPSDPLGADLRGEMLRGVANEPRAGLVETLLHDLGADSGGNLLVQPRDNRRR